MTTRIELQREKEAPLVKEERKIKKPFDKEEEPLSLGSSPIHLFQQICAETAAEIPSEVLATPSIDEIYLTLCERIEHCSTNGIEETTIILAGERGEITLIKYDTAPMQFSITLSLSEQVRTTIIPHIPELSSRLSDHFQDIEFSLHTQLLSLRKEEKKYAVQKEKGSF